MGPALVESMESSEEDGGGVSEGGTKQPLVGERSKGRNGLWYTTWTNSKDALLQKVKLEPLVFNDRNVSIWLASLANVLWPHGLDVEDLVTWARRGDTSCTIPISETADGIFLAYLMSCLAKSQHLTLTLGKAVNHSGALALAAVLKRFTAKKGVQTRRNIRVLQNKLDTLPNEDASKFDCWADEVAQAWLNVTEGLSEDNLVFLNVIARGFLLQATAPDGIFGGLVRGLDGEESDELDLEAILEMYRATALRQGEHGGKARAKALLAKEVAGGESELQNLFAKWASSQKPKGECFTFRDTGKCPFGSKCKWSHDKQGGKNSKQLACNKCGDTQHATQDCSRVSATTFCAKCLRQGHVQSACRSKQQASPEQKEEVLKQLENKRFSFAYSSTTPSPTQLSTNTTFILDTGCVNRS